MKNNEYINWLFSVIKSNRLSLYNVICIQLINGRKEEITIGHLFNLYAKADLDLQKKLKSEFMIDAFFSKGKADIINCLIVIFNKLICENVQQKGE